MFRTLRIVAVACTFILFGCLAGDAQEPKKEPPKEGKGFQKGPGGGRFGGPGGPGGGQVGQVLPSFLMQILQLSDDQKKEVEALQKDVDAKLAKILTEDQQKRLKEMREGGRGGFGGGFGGRGGPDGKGGPRGKGGPDGKGPPKGEPKKDG